MEKLTYLDKEMSLLLRWNSMATDFSNNYFSLILLCLHINLDFRVSLYLKFQIKHLTRTQIYSLIQLEIPISYIDFQEFVSTCKYSIRTTNILIVRF